MGARFCVDTLASQHLVGRAELGTPSGNEDQTESLPAVVLTIGDDRVAMTACRRRSLAGEANLAQSDLTGVFALPFLPALVYTALLGRGRFDALRISLLDSTLAAPSLATQVTSMADFRPLLLADGLQARISDLWFTDSRQLRLRLDCGPQADAPSAMLAFYQFDLRQGRLAAPVARRPLPQGIGFVTVELLNPYLPLLIGLDTADGDSQAVDLLPFPSLCRGGCHYAELKALGLTGRYIEDLRSVSLGLVREHLGWPNGAAHAIGRIAAPEGEAGAAAILSQEVRDWISVVFGIGVDIGPPAGEAAQGRTLGLPSDSLPTISSLVSRRLNLPPDASQASGPFVVADAASGAPRAMIVVPSLPGWLDDLQPPGAPRFYPILSGPAAPVQDAKPAMSVVDIPLAIRFLGDAGPGAGPGEHSLCGGMARLPGDGLLVSVVVSTRECGLADLIRLGESLASQSLGDRLELLVIAEDWQPAFAAAAARALERTFDDRFRIIACDDGNQSRRRNEAVAKAKGETIVFADADIVLPYPGTVEALVTLCGHERVASAACLLVSPGDQNGAPAVFESAGIFPLEVSLVGRPLLTFGALDCGVMLADATYPVVANLLSLCAVKAAVWNSLGGLDATQFPADGGDIDLGLRAIDNGYVNLCTTGMAAHRRKRPFARTIWDTHSTRYLTRLPLDRLLGRCTVVRNLDDGFSLAVRSRNSAAQ